MNPSTPSLPRLPYGLSYAAPIEQKLDWQIIIELLPVRDELTEFYTPRDLEPLFGIRATSISRHCQQLWPERRSHWRLSFAEICALVRKIWFHGRPRRTRAELEQMLREKWGRDLEAAQQISRHDNLHEAAMIAGESSRTNAFDTPQKTSNAISREFRRSFSKA